MTHIDLIAHMTGTYRAIRVGIAVIAIAFPPLLWLGGWIGGNVPLQHSMSAYYYAGAPLASDAGVMRNWFVGILFAVGTVLFLYRGITWLEDYALNVAGVLAWGIALFPMAPPGSKEGWFSPHGVCAVLFFVSIAYVCIFRAPDTLPLITDDARRARYRRSYRILGILMPLSPLLAFLSTAILARQGFMIFFVEAAGVYVFAAYWLLKSREVAQTNADRRAARGELRVRDHSWSDAFRAVSVDATLAASGSAAE